VKPIATRKNRFTQTPSVANLICSLRLRFFRINRYYEIILYRCFLIVHNINSEIIWPAIKANEALKIVAQKTIQDALFVLTEYQRNILE
jgi:hypothetical protein